MRTTRQAPESEAHYFLFSSMTYSLIASTAAAVSLGVYSLQRKEEVLGKCLFALAGFYVSSLFVSFKNTNLFFILAGFLGQMTSIFSCAAILNHEFKNSAELMVGAGIAYTCIYDIVLLILHLSENPRKHGVFECPSITLFSNAERGSHANEWPGEEDDDTFTIDFNP